MKKKNVFMQLRCSLTKDLASYRIAAEYNNIKPPGGMCKNEGEFARVITSSRSPSMQRDEEKESGGEKGEQGVGLPRVCMEIRERGFYRCTRVASVE